MTRKLLRNAFSLAAFTLVGCLEMGWEVAWNFVQVHPGFSALWGSARTGWGAGRSPQVQEVWSDRCLTPHPCS